MTVRKYLRPMIMLAIFETIAITFWLTKDNVFYQSLSKFTGSLQLTTEGTLVAVYDTFHAEDAFGAVLSLL